MDALTLFVIVQLANGEVRTVHATPMPMNRSCTEAAENLHHGYIANHYLRAGAKRVMFYCAPTAKPLRIAR
jgi:hypothetical protein